MLISNLILFNLLAQQRSLVLPLGAFGTKTVIPRRYKHKKKWAEVRKTLAPSVLAMRAFDGMYGDGPYEKTWRSIRLALLSMPKYCAVVNNFNAKRSDVESRLLDLGAVPLDALISTESSHDVDHLEAAPTDNRLPEAEELQPSSETEPDHADQFGLPIRGMEAEDYQSYETVSPEAASTEAAEFTPASKVSMEDVMDKPLPVNMVDMSNHARPVIGDVSPPRIPYYLKAYVFPRRNITRFPAPGTDLTGFFDYYLMDAASLLPVFALDIRPGDSVYDMCAAPGGKSLTMLQTMLPGRMVCNDTSISRTRRLEHILQTFFPMDLPEMAEKIKVTSHDALWFYTGDKFDRILVDVPCTTDRISCTEDENNLFTSRRTGERNRLPQLQMDILKSACDAVKVGGIVVYSTCSLSPVQNDGVVHLAIEELERDHGIKMAVVDTSGFRSVFAKVFQFYPAVSTYGQTVVPHVANNFGPMYFVKLRKVAAVEK